MIYANTNPTYLYLITFNYSSLSIQNSQTDCDDDDECQNGLICFQRDDLEAVPGCSGEDNRDLDGKDVCVTKCTADYCVLHNIGNNINPGEGHYGRCEVRINSMMTLHIYLNCTLCNQTYSHGIWMSCSLQQGDCDNDSDCKGDLKCFDRSNDEDVPGCVGNTAKHARRGRDYCY